MDAETVLKSEIFKPIVITLVPGIMAAAPFVFVSLHFYPMLFNEFERYQIFYITIMLAIIIAVGLVLEDFGSRLEVSFWNDISTDKDDDNWYEYLNKPRTNAPSDSYIRSIVMRMKFESSFAFGSVFFAIGITWLFLLDKLSCCAYALGTISVLMLAAYLFCEFRAGVQLLIELRARLARLEQQA